MMSAMILENEILSFDQLENVAGGTFTPNKYEEPIYNQAGIRTKWHILDKDEFFMNDKKGKMVPITMEQADWAVAYWKEHNIQAVYEQVANKIKH